MLLRSRAHRAVSFVTGKLSASVEGAARGLGRASHGLFPAPPVKRTPRSAAVMATATPPLATHSDMASTPISNARSANVEKDAASGHSPSMEELIEKAAVLHEALPYIRRFHGETVVIKYGGHAMVDADLRNSFARDVVLMKFVGICPVVVHGGGPQIDQQLAARGVQAKRVDGLRITDAPTMEVVEMVLGGTVNQEIVSLMCRHGGRAVGLTGRDDGFLAAKPVGEVKSQSGASVDVGRVGQAPVVKPQVVEQLVEGGFIPVIAPVAVGDDGASLNVNADTVAGAVAEALGARKLMLMTDTPGVKGADGEVLSSLHSEEARSLRQAGVIAGGMIPKVDCALHALGHGVKKAHILDGRTQHAVLLELFTDKGVGTELFL